MADKILFVDDEISVLEGYRRLLYKDFDIETAAGGAAGLEMIRSGSRFAVIVSDVRMPGMGGVEFLSTVRSIDADAVRMVLTGYAEINAAIAAVNDGRVFRFLTKPCEKPELVSALTAGLEQHRLITAERELLEKTLNGTVKVLTELMAMVNPAAFGRATRLRKYVHHVSSQWKLSSSWRFEMAAMLSQLGCVTLDAETITFAYSGLNLSPDARARFDAHPQIAKGLLSNIPRLEKIVSIIEQQANPLPALAASVNPDGIDADVLGAHLLKIAVAYDILLNQGRSPALAVAELKSSTTGLDRQIAEALAGLDSVGAERQIKKCPIGQLTPGMLLEEDVKTMGGLLLVKKGEEINKTLLVHLRAYNDRGAISNTVLVSVPALVAEPDSKLPGIGR